jgi:ABC-type branched-subunit amino acid transport system substrate-binding protein
LRGRLKVGAPVSLSGRYAVQGREARAGLEAWAQDYRVELLLRDDRSSPEDAAQAHRQLMNTCRFVVGPYGSDSTRAVAEQAPGQVVWNHGAAADDVQRLPGVVSVPSPASDYLVVLARTVSRLRPNAAVCLLTAPGRFAAWARSALIVATPTLGLQLVDDPAAADVLLLCGPLTWEIQHLQRLHRPGLLTGGVSPGLANFPQLLGADPEGLLAPVQWHPEVPTRPQLGPASIQLPGYLAAQAYAAALIADHCHQLAHEEPLTAAKHLQTVTFFGGFKLDRDGLQTGHQLSVIRWKNRRQELQPTPAD